MLLSNYCKLRMSFGTSQRGDLIHDAIFTGYAYDGSPITVTYIVVTNYIAFFCYVGYQF